MVHRHLQCGPLARVADGGQVHRAELNRPVQLDVRGHEQIEWVAGARCGSHRRRRRALAVAVAVRRAKLRVDDESRQDTGTNEMGSTIPPPLVLSSTPLQARSGRWTTVLIVLAAMTLGLAAGYFLGQL